MKNLFRICVCLLFCKDFLVICRNSGEQNRWNVHRGKQTRDDVVDSHFVHFGPFCDTASQLSQHSLDFCIISQRENIPVFHPLCRDSITAWVPKNHPAVARGIYKASDLWTDDYIELYPDLETDNSLFLERNDLRPSVCAATSDIYAAYAMVEAGLGVVLINTLLSHRWQGDVVSLPLDRSSDFEIGIAAKSVEECSPAAREFLNFILPDLKNADIRIQKL